MLQNYLNSIVNLSLVYGNEIKYGGNKSLYRGVPN